MFIYGLIHHCVKRFELKTSALKDTGQSRQGQCLRPKQFFSLFLLNFDLTIMACYKSFDKKILVKILLKQQFASV